MPDPKGGLNRFAYYTVILEKIIARRFEKVSKADLDQYISEIKQEQPDVNANVNNLNIIFIPHPLPNIAVIREILIETNEEGLMHPVKETMPQQTERSAYNYNYNYNNYNYSRHNYSKTFEPVSCFNYIDCPLCNIDMLDDLPQRREIVTIGLPRRHPHAVKETELYHKARKLELYKLAMRTFSVMDSMSEALEKLEELDERDDHQAVGSDDPSDPDSPAASESSATTGSGSESNSKAEGSGESKTPIG